MLHLLYTATYVRFLSMNKNTFVVSDFSSDKLFCRCAMTDSSTLLAVRWPLSSQSCHTFIFVKIGKAFKYCICKNFRSILCIIY